MLNLDWNFVWAILNILILYVLLRIFLFKPINKMMNERTRSIQNDIDSAQKAKQEADEMKEQYAEALENAKTEAQKIISKAKDEADSQKKDIINQSHDEAEQIIQSANKTIENERKRSMQQAQSEIADLAIAAASKIIGENVDDTRNRQLVDEFLSEEGAIDHD